MLFHSKKTEEVIRELSTDLTLGLSSEEVAERKLKYGENRLREKKKKSGFGRFIDQFKDAMIIILLLAAVVSACVVAYEVFVTGEGNPSEFFEPALILIIVVFNAIMGVMQESKAEKALDALKSMSAPHARVIRNGEEKVIEASELVPGDIIRLEAGDFVPADARLIHSVSLKSEESALTGESVPSDKDAAAVVDEKAPLGDRTNMVFSGCSITYGTATAVVTGIGMNTEMGKIAGLLDNAGDSQTPLQKKLATLGKYLGIVALIACAIVFAVGIITNGWEHLMEMFMVAVSLAVSAIPEGLPIVVTIVLSIGVQRMVKKNALIRRLPAVETLGSASVICSDKTGTLTQNRMTLTKAYVDGGEIELISNENSADVRQLLDHATLCCDGSVVFGEDGREVHIGDPTETAIVLAAYKNGSEKSDLNERYPRLCELPFDSDRKLMTTVNRIDGKNVVIVKGAFDVMATRCVQGDIERAREITNSMSRDALRVLAIGYKIIDEIPDAPTSELLESDLVFMGLVGMIDPPRPEAKDAVAICRRAGIKPVMITGDHVITAQAIAREIGIFEEGDLAITGAELDAMTDEELDSKVEQISVYARVSPENKIRIVKAWQRKGQVVSMTGDGVNDAPALKAADIGCAMGITGTDVAKGASDMTLTDDNFATIVDAVKEGRGIYANIRKVVGFLLGTNISEVITVFCAMMISGVSPLLSMQLLWINLVGDSLPAIALGMERIEEGIMDEKPKPKGEGLFAHGLGFKIIFSGVMFSILTLVGFYIGCGQIFGLSELPVERLQAGRTMAFMILALSQTVHAYNMRSERSVFSIGVFSNKYVNLANLAAVALMSLVLFTPLNTVFGLVYLDLKLYLIALGLILVPLAIMEIYKLVQRLVLKARANKNNR